MNPQSIQTRPRVISLAGVAAVWLGLLFALVASPTLADDTKTIVKGRLVYGGIHRGPEDGIQWYMNSVFSRGLAEGQPIPHVWVGLKNGLALVGVFEDEDITDADGNFDLVVTGTPDELHLITKAKNDYVNVKDASNSFIYFDLDKVLHTNVNVRDRVSLSGGTEDIGDVVVADDDDEDHHFTVEGTDVYISRAFYICGAAHTSAKNIESYFDTVDLPKVNVRFGMQYALDVDVSDILGFATLTWPWSNYLSDMFEWFFDTSVLDWPPGIGETAFYLQSGNVIFLADIDAETVWHEYGHFLEDQLAAFALIPCYGSHSDCKQMETTFTDNPNLCWAWLEGLATWFGAVNSSSLHGLPEDYWTPGGDPDTNLDGKSDSADDVNDDGTVDAVDVNLRALGYAYEIETNTCSSSDWSSWSDARAVESVVANVLWDLIDSQQDVKTDTTQPDEVAAVPVEEVLELIFMSLGDLKDDYGLDLDNTPCGAIEVNAHLMGLDQFWSAWRATHPGPVPELYAAYAFNRVDTDEAEDLTGPESVSVEAPTHPERTWRKDNTVTFIITDGDDDVSGSYYYIVQADHDPATLLDASGPIAFPSKYAENLYSLEFDDADDHYVHFRTKDMAFHADAGTITYGPVMIDTVKPEWVVSGVHFPDPGKALLIGKHAHIEWQATDALSGADHVDILYDDDPTDATGPRAVATIDYCPGTDICDPPNYEVTGSWDVYLDPDLFLPTNAGQFTIIVYDQANNESDPITTPPMNIVSPFEGPFVFPFVFGSDLTNGRTVSGDLNGDGVDEIVLSGASGLGTLTLQVVTLSPAGSINYVTPGLQGGDLFLADVDRDGDLDLVAGGDFGAATPEIHIYTNDGTGSLTSTGPLSFTPPSDIVLRVIDLYGTGEPILVFGGKRGTGAVNQELRAYNLATAGPVTLLTGTYFRGGDFEVGDINADGFFDFVTLGENSSGDSTVRWYTGGINQEGQFRWAEVTGEVEIFEQIGDVDLGNWDTDNKLDLFMMYRQDDGTTVHDFSELWDWSSGTFEMAVGAEMRNRIAEGDGHIVEIYNDGFSDVLALGRKATGGISSWYETYGPEGQRSSGVPWPIRATSLFDTDTAFGDFDGDGDLDFVVTGLTTDGTPRTVWFECMVSENGEPNDYPPVPVNLQSVYDPVRGGYVFSWEPPTGGDETATTAFEYEIRVGSTPGGTDIVSWAHPAARSQQVVGQPNGPRLERFVPLLPGAYDWDVRTVDGGWRRSQPYVPPVCGNGLVESGEGCDDGGTSTGDGCSDLCQVEDGYACTGEPSICTRTVTPVTWTCGTNVWSTTSCWSGLVPGDGYPDGPDVPYAVSMPPGEYLVTVDPAAVTTNSLSMSSIVTEVRVNAGHDLTIHDALTGPGILSAIGTGSTVNLPNLISLAGPAAAGSVLTLEAGSNGRVELSNLTSVTGNVKFYAHNDNAIATINCPRLERLSAGAEIFVQTGGRFIGAPLVDLSGVTVTVHHSRSVLDTSAVTSLDEARVLADGGAVVSFPSVTSYTAGALDCGNHSLQAKNPDTQLSFPSLTAIHSNPCQSLRLGVYKSPEQPRSGHLLLPALTSMTGRTNIFADGPDGLIELGMADLAADATLSVANGAELRVLGSMSYAMTNPASFVWGAGATVNMTGGAGAGGCATLEVAGLDSGNVDSGWTSNFQLQRLLIGPGARIQLVDNVNNGHRGGAGGSAEALYVDTIEFADSAGRIGLGGLHLYYRTLIGDPGQILPLGCDTPRPPDFNGDGDVDGDDVSWFQECAAGPMISLAPSCEPADRDGDGDGDQVDFGVVQRCYSGPNKPTDPTCAR